LKTDANDRMRKKLRRFGDFETIWGDILDFEGGKAAIEGIEVIIHLAGIIPPLSDKNPDLARRVNIDGTVNVIQAAETMNPKPKFIFASSVSIYGPTMHLTPPLKASDPVNPTDVYTHTKVKCEEIIHSSSLPWTILRFGAAPPFDTSGDMKMLFEMPLDQRIEFVHTRDVGEACANAVTAEIIGKTLLIGGGKESQMLQRDFIRRILTTMGLELPPESAFKQPKNDDEWYYTDWLDTEESQQLLQYQKHTFEDYLEEAKKAAGFKRHLAKLFSGQAMKQILQASPYYKEDNEE
jgi:nucleoside-diphosphate-sugar epimerase